MNANNITYSEFYVMIVPNEMGPIKHLKVTGIDAAGVELEIREAYENISWVHVVPA